MGGAHSKIVQNHEALMKQEEVVPVDIFSVFFINH